MDNKWIKVESYKDVPIGTWLCKTVERYEGEVYHTIYRRKIMTMIGGNFTYDMPRVVAYQAILDENGDNINNKFNKQMSTKPTPSEK